MSNRSKWPTVLVRSSVNSLMFCPLGLSIIEIRVVKFLAIIVNFSISPFYSVSFCFMYSESLLLHAYTFRITASF